MSLIANFVCLSELISSSYSEKNQNSCLKFPLMLQMCDNIKDSKTIIF